MHETRRCYHHASDATRGSQRRGPSFALEVLHRAFVFDGGRARGKSPQVAPTTGLRILDSGIQPVTAGRKFSNHEISFLCFGIA
jgi:hypothetical protein